MTERDFSTQVLSELSEHFFIREQVKGKHYSGEKMLLDALLIPQSVEGWKNENVKLGVEFKDRQRINGTNEFTTWLAQCADYANTRWDGVDGFIYIFTCPGLIDGLPEFTRSDFIIPRIMAQLGVGELKCDDWHGWSFFLNGDHRVWSVKDGVELGQYHSMKRKFGSR